MSETKWTPGPWKAPEGDFPDVYGPDDRLLAVVYAPGNYEHNSQEGHANARLIAAAPDLLDALQEAMRWIGRLTDWEGAGDPDADSWRAAIAKAKGGE